MSNLYENARFAVVQTDDAIGEDGQYGRKGYAVVNKDTGIEEHTTTVLAQAMFQADAFEGALGQLADADDLTGALEADEGDIVLQ